jgi:lipopolysaccharide kinase (Kdo/WaaP) family protein
LRSLDVPTPRIACYVTYPAAAGFERADVATLEIAHSEDLAVALMSGDVGIRNRALKAAALLVGLLGRAKARHHDLNVKNILLSAEREGEPTALVLDVDRVEFLADGMEATEANLARLLRSARKWQTEHKAQVTDTELEVFAAAARSRAAAYLAKPS